MENSEIERIVNQLEKSADLFVESLKELENYVNKCGTPSIEYQQRSIKAAEKIDNC